MSGLLTVSNVGSSPRVWGQADDLTDTNGGKRIIPTRMGTSDSLRNCIISNKDHPHAYGDKTIAIKPRLAVYGSSPRVWGQVKYWCNKILPLGIIPTRMGTSFTVRRIQRERWDHPHAYGDKYADMVRR